MDWASTEIAKKVKSDPRQRLHRQKQKGQVVNRLENIAHMGSSKLDNEECWLVTAMARALGLVYIDHQARV